MIINAIDWMSTILFNPIIILTFIDKLTIVIIISLIILLFAILFIYWYFNRKFDVVFDYNNGKTEEILVKYKNSISEKDVVGKEKLGEEFLGWYLVTIDKDGKEILSSEPFDFTTSIKNNIKLKAVFKGKEEEPVVKEEKPKKEEKITIKFDSNGGSLVSSISLKKGSALTLPKNPTRDGYTFNEWQTKDGKSVKNKTKFSSNTTLYAKWTKNEEPKPEPVESISLSLTNYYIHVNGISTSTAKAKVENASGDVTYSMTKNNCMNIDPKTGVITSVEKPSSGSALAFYNRVCGKGITATVTATLPSGKNATATINFEKTLELTLKGNVYDKNTKLYLNDDKFLITSNQKVTWSVNKYYEPTEKFNSEINTTETSCEVEHNFNTYPKITAKTKAGQIIELDVFFVVN